MRWSLLWSHWHLAYPQSTMTRENAHYLPRYAGSSMRIVAVSQSVATVMCVQSVEMGTQQVLVLKPWGRSPPQRHRQPAGMQPGPINPVVRERTCCTLKQCNTCCSYIIEYYYIHVSLIQVGGTYGMVQSRACQSKGVHGSVTVMIRL